MTKPTLIDGRYGHRDWSVPELTGDDSPTRLCSPTLLYRLMNRGEFGPDGVYAVGNRRKVRGVAIDAFVARNTITSTERKPENV